MSWFLTIILTLFSYIQIPSNMLFLFRWTGLYPWLSNAPTYYYEHHAVFMALWWVIGFGVVYLGYNLLSRRTDSPWGVIVFNIVLTFVGAYASYAATDSKHNELKLGDFTIPNFFLTPVYIIVAFVLAKVLLSLYSLGITEGLLPDSLKKNVAREEKLRKTFEADKAMVDAISAINRDTFRETIRAARFQRDDKKYILAIIETTLTDVICPKLRQAGFAVDYTWSLEEEIDTQNEAYEDLHPRVTAAARKAVEILNRNKALDRQGNNTAKRDLLAYDSDLKSYTVVSQAIEFNGTIAIASVVLPDEVIDPAPFENFWLVFIDLLKNKTLTDYQTAMEIWKQRGILIETEAGIFVESLSQQQMQWYD